MIWLDWYKKHRPGRVNVNALQDETKHEYIMAKDKYNDVKTNGFIMILAISGQSLIIKLLLCPS